MFYKLRQKFRQTRDKNIMEYPFIIRQVQQVNVMLSLLVLSHSQGVNFFVLVPVNVNRNVRVQVFKFTKIVNFKWKRQLSGVESVFKALIKTNAIVSTRVRM